VHSSAPKYTFGIVGGMLDGSQKCLEMQGAGASQHRPASTCTSEGDGTRTRNHRIDSPAASGKKTLENKAKTSESSSSYTAPYTDSPELADILGRWDTLPPNVRAAILALAGPGETPKRKAA
jgi:hypothetical protein